MAWPVGPTLNRWREFMFITKKHLSRRTFLHGAGVTVALPFLEAMVPAQTPLARTAANPRAKFGFIYVPMGSIMKQWIPEQGGVGFEFSPILKPLEPFRENVVRSEERRVGKECSGG